MNVYFVGAGPGDPELLTVKAHRLLTACQCCVYTGSLINPEVLELLPAHAEMHNSAGMTKEEISAVYQDAHSRDVDVIRLHTGDPVLYSAIGEQMLDLERLGISYEIIPGISSYQAAAASLGVELTVPETAQTVILTRRGGRTPVPEEQELERLAASKTTLCIFLSVQQIDNVTAVLADSYGKDCPAAVIYRASWPDETIIRGTVADIAEKTQQAGISKTAVIVAGPALEQSEAASKLYDKTFTHGYRSGENE